MYYGSNDFEAALHLHEMTMAVEWIRGIVVRCGSAPFRQFNFFIARHTWPDLQDMLPLAQLVLETDLKLEPRPVREPDPISDEWPSWYRENHLRMTQEPKSLFHFASSWKREFQRVLESAVQLGQKASVEGWHEDWLDVEFGLWIEEKLNSGPGADMSKRREGKHKLKRMRAQEAGEKEAIQKADEEAEAAEFAEI